MRFWRGTTDSHDGVMLHGAACSGTGAGRDSTVLEGVDARITASMARSHPGIPSRSISARPTPRGDPAGSGRGASVSPAPMTWARSCSYSSVYWVTSSAVASTITAVFFPAASGREAVDVGCCAGGRGCRSAPPIAPPAAPRPACVRTRAPPAPGSRAPRR